MSVVRFNGKHHDRPRTRSKSTLRDVHELRYLRCMLLDRVESARKHLGAMQFARTGNITHHGGLHSGITDLRDALRLANELSNRIMRANAP
jgi:hypothetical protein